MSLWGSMGPVDDVGRTRWGDVPYRLVPECGSTGVTREPARDADVSWTPGMRTV